MLHERETRGGQLVKLNSDKSTVETSYFLYTRVYPCWLFLQNENITILNFFYQDATHTYLSKALKAHHKCSRVFCYIGGHIHVR